MSSILSVNTLQVTNIQNSSGQNVIVNGYPRQPGQIIEVLSSVCDGSSVTVGSGTYTFQNVTTQQGYVGVAFTDINGSIMNYTPPAGTTRVMYEFTFASYWVGAHAINSYAFYIDGVQVTNSFHNRSSMYLEDKSSMKWTIAIGGTADPSVGRVSSWTAPRQLKTMYYQYGGSNYANLHGTYYANGTTGNVFNRPILTITAIA
jgi:hypothetical protein